MKISRAMMVDNTFPHSSFICTLTRAILSLLRRTITEVIILAISYYLSNKVHFTLAGFQKQLHLIRTSLKTQLHLKAAWDIQHSFLSVIQMLVRFLLRPFLEINSKLILSLAFLRDNF